jgi:hypothetical protein
MCEYPLASVVPHACSRLSSMCLSLTAVSVGTLSVHRAGAACLPWHVFAVVRDVVEECTERRILT